MARLTKEEKKVFDPSLLIQNQKWKSDTIKDLTISGGGKGGSPGTPTPDWDKGWPPPAPLKNPKLANFLTPSGSGRTISDEAYWDGLNTILSTTEAGSDEQNKRLNILMHQFQDQVKKPQKDLKIAETDPLSDYDVTDKGLYMNYMGDMYMNLDGFLFPMGQGYDEGTHGKLVPKGLVQNNAADGLKIAEKRLPFINIDNLEDPVKTLKDGGYPDPDVLDFPSGGYYRKGSNVLDKLIDLELVNKMKINPKKRKA